MQAATKQAAVILRPWMGNGELSSSLAVVFRVARITGYDANPTG